MTPEPINVTRLAVAQMRAAREARDAYEAWVALKGTRDDDETAYWDARWAWHQAAKAAKAANRAYDRACAETTIEAVPAADEPTVDQPDLFGP